MHSFLRAIGFERIDNTKLDEIISQVIEQPNYMNLAEDSNGNEFVEFSKDFGDSIGITVCGYYRNNGEFEKEYYYPYFRGSGTTTEEYMEIEKHGDKESYAVVCDDVKVGVTLIFYLQNVAEYLVEKNRCKRDFTSRFSATLSGLSLSGKILLPIQKNENQILRNEKMTESRNQMVAAARDGDEEAMESLTLEDMDTYLMLSKRIVNEDVLSIVDTYFMPYGIESDQYSVMGEILNVYHIQNTATKQKMYVMTVDTNDLIYDICIHEHDLFGEPKEGRRFKGNVWLQGSLKIRK